MPISFPYGKTHIDLTIKDTFTYEVLSAHSDSLPSGLSGAQCVEHAMQAPIGSKRLDELAVGKGTAVVIISDHTRPVPSKDILPAMLGQMRAKNSDIEITLLVATGCHRGSCEDELRQKLGDEIYENEKIVVHDCTVGNVPIGTLPSGAELRINKIAADADLLVAEGFIEPHFFAGYSGGRKSVLPGICDRKTVFGNHCAAFISHECSRAGILDGNLIHRDMVAAVRMVNLEYIVNVILDKDQHTIHAFAGDAIEAHLAGCEKLKSICCVKPEKKGDIIISSNNGAPLDQNIYQTVKSMSTCEACAAEDACIIICSECIDGAGSRLFYEVVRDCKDMAPLYEQTIAIAQDDTPHDQWQYQIMARIMMKHHVIMVTEPNLKGMVEEMKMQYAHTLDEALDIAIRRKGPDAHIVAVPDGVGVIVVE